MNRAVTEQMLLFSDATFGNATTLRHGLLPKLAGGTTSFFRADGTWAVPPGGSGGPTFLASGAAVDIVSSTTETDLCSFTIPANAIGANGFARLTLVGDFLYNSAGATLSIRIKNGATALWGIATAQTTTGTRYAWWLEATIGNKNITTDNALGVNLPLSGTADLPDYGGAAALGRFAGITGRGINVACAIDTTASWTFKVTGQWNVSSAALSIRKHHAYVEYFNIA